MENWDLAASVVLLVAKYARCRIVWLYTIQVLTRCISSRAMTSIGRGSCELPPLLWTLFTCPRSEEPLDDVFQVVLVFPVTMDGCLRRPSNGIGTFRILLRKLDRRSYPLKCVGSPDGQQFVI